MWHPCCFDGGMASRDERADALDEIGRHLLSFADADEMGSYVARRALELLDAQASALSWLDGGSGRPVASAGRPVGGGARRRLARVRDRAADPAEDADEIESARVLCVPVRVGPRTVGVLEVMDGAHGVFSAQDRSRLEGLAEHAAAAYARIIGHDTGGRGGETEVGLRTLVIALALCLLLGALLLIGRAMGLPFLWSALLCLGLRSRPRHEAETRGARPPELRVVVDNGSVAPRARRPPSDVRRRGGSPDVREGQR